MDVCGSRYIRDDHLNEPRFFKGSYSERIGMKYGAAWNSPEILARYRWLFLSTGTHLNDDADLRSNKNKVWDHALGAWSVWTDYGRRGYLPDLTSQLLRAF